jgi:hypothetical protein
MADRAVQMDLPWYDEPMEIPLLDVIRQERALSISAGRTSPEAVAYRLRCPEHVDTLMGIVGRLGDLLDYDDLLSEIEALGIANYTLRHDTERDPRQPYTATTLRWSGQAFYGSTRLEALRKLRDYTREHSQ